MWHRLSVWAEIRNPRQKTRLHSETWLIPDPLEREEYQILRKPIHFYNEEEEVPEYLVEDNQTLVDCDAYVIVTPEYNRLVTSSIDEPTTCSIEYVIDLLHAHVELIYDLPTATLFEPLLRSNLVRTNYSRCIPGALSNLMNHFPPATFAAKPVGVVSYSLGRLGGSCVSIQLREYLTELAMINLPIMVSRQ